MDAIEEPWEQKPCFQDRRLRTVVRGEPSTRNNEDQNEVQNGSLEQLCDYTETQQLCGTGPNASGTDREPGRHNAFEPLEAPQLLYPLGGNATPGAEDHLSKKKKTEMVYEMGT